MALSHIKGLTQPSPIWDLKNRIKGTFCYFGNKNFFEPQFKNVQQNYKFSVNILEVIFNFSSWLTSSYDHLDMLSSF